MSKSILPIYLPCEPEDRSKVLLILIASGIASWVCPVNITSKFSKLDASF